MTIEQFLDHLGLAAL